MNKGMKVKVSDNLERTSVKFGLTPEMKKMKNKVFEVMHTFGEEGICLSDGRDSWSFSSLDLIPAEKIKIQRIKPKLFDLNELVLE